MLSSGMWNAAEMRWYIVVAWSADEEWHEWRTQWWMEVGYQPRAQPLLPIPWFDYPNGVLFANQEHIVMNLLLLLHHIGESQSTWLVGTNVVATTFGLHIDIVLCPVPLDSCPIWYSPLYTTQIFRLLLYGPLLWSLILIYVWVCGGRLLSRILMLIMNGGGWKYWTIQEVLWLQLHNVMGIDSVVEKINWRMVP